MMTSLPHHCHQLHVPAHTTGPSPHTGLGTLTNPNTFTYHLAPSTLAYLPLTSDLPSHAHSSSAVAVDTGYVSGEPSPTEHAQVVSVSAIIIPSIDNLQYH